MIARIRQWFAGSSKNSDSTVEAANVAARSARFAARMTLVAALLTGPTTAAVDGLNENQPSYQSCTAEKIAEYEELRENSLISDVEYSDLRTDALEDEIDDAADSC